MESPNANLHVNAVNFLLDCLVLTVCLYILYQVLFYLYLCITYFLSSMCSCVRRYFAGLWGMSMSDAIFMCSDTGKLKMTETAIEPMLCKDIERKSTLWSLR